MNGLTDKNFWKKLAPKSQVTLTDALALEASQMQGRGLQGMEYVLEEILYVSEYGKLCEWYICRLVHPEQELYLVAKIIGDDVQIRVYYAPPAVKSGTRKEQVESNNLFLFNESKNWHDYLKLQHASEISWDFVTDGKTEQVHFIQKGNQELTGRAAYHAQGSGYADSLPKEPMLATISEYFAETKCSDPEIMILEVGSMHSTVGGVIKVLLGGPINEFEISILNAKKSPIVSGPARK